MFTNSWPFADLSQVNLDWLFGTMKNILEGWQAMEDANKQHYKKMQDAYDSLRRYVAQYVHEQDVSAEVAEAIQRAIDSGLFESTIAQAAGLQEIITSSHVSGAPFGGAWVGEPMTKPLEDFTSQDILGMWDAIRARHGQFMSRTSTAGGALYKGSIADVAAKLGVEASASGNYVYVTGLGAGYYGFDVQSSGISVISLQGSTDGSNYNDLPDSARFNRSSSATQLLTVPAAFELEVDPSVFPNMNSFRVRITILPTIVAADEVLNDAAVVRMRSGRSGALTVYKWQARAHKWGSSSDNDYYSSFENNRQNARSIFVTGGIHGNEKANVYALVKNFSEWADSTGGIGARLLNLYDWYIIPIVNEYGFDHNQRSNAYGVDINRNFACASWPGSDAANKGNAPASEWETQAVQNALEQFINPAHLSSMLVIDSHDFTWSNKDNLGIMSRNTAVGTEIRREGFDTASYLVSWILNQYPAYDLPNYPRKMRVQGLTTESSATCTHYASEQGFRLAVTTETPNDLPPTGEKQPAEKYGPETMRIAWRTGEMYYSEFSELANRGAQAVIERGFAGVGINTRNAGYNAVYSRLGANSVIYNDITSSESSYLDRFELPVQARGALSVYKPHSTDAEERYDATFEYQTYEKTGASVFRQGVYSTGKFPELNERFTGWFKLGVYNNSDFNKGMPAFTSLTDLINEMPEYSVAVLRATENSLNSRIMTEMPVNDNGILEISKVYSSSTTQVAMLRFSLSGSDREWRSRWNSSSGIVGWKEYQMF